MADTLVNVKADTIEDFLKNAQAAIREGKGEIGVTTYLCRRKIEMSSVAQSRNDTLCRRRTR